MPFFTLGADAAPKTDEKLSALGKLLTGAVLAGGAVLVLRSAGKPHRVGIEVTRVSEGLPEHRELRARITRSTQRIPVESMSQIVYGRRT
jgi:hypothetical protein